MNYDFELREEKRRFEQEQRHPRPVGDVITEDDISLWEKRKKEMEDENAKQF